MSPAGPAPGWGGWPCQRVARDGGRVQSVGRKGATHRQHTPSWACWHQDEMSVWEVERSGGRGTTTGEPGQGGLQKPGRGGACGCGTQSFDSRLEGIPPDPGPPTRLPSPDSRVFLIASHQMRWDAPERRDVSWAQKVAMQCWPRPRTREARRARRPLPNSQGQNSGRGIFQVQVATSSQAFFLLPFLAPRSRAAVDRMDHQLGVRAYVEGHRMDPHCSPFLHLGASLFKVSFAW